MTLDKFTIKAAEAVQEAVSIAERRGQQVIEPEHLLGGIMEKGTDVVTYVLQKSGANMSQLKRVVEQSINHLPRVEGGQPYLSSTSNQVMQRTMAISEKMGDEYVSI